MVFRVIRGKVVVSRKPNMNGSEPSGVQIEHRERFKQAVAYGKSVMADGEVRQLYKTGAKAKNMPIFALTVADFFNAPSVQNVDLSAYNGQAGDVLTILAGDDFSIMSVHVSITDERGNIVESGKAEETAEGSDCWSYTATITVESNVNVQVVATDCPGGTAVMNVSKSF